MGVKVQIYRALVLVYLFWRITTNGIGAESRIFIINLGKIKSMPTNMFVGLFLPVMR